MLFEKVLFATDFSDVSSGALSYVLRLREAGCRRVILVHVIDTRDIAVIERSAGVGEDPAVFESNIAVRMREHAEREMSDIETAIRENGMETTTHILEGIPHQEILRIADAEEVSVLVVGSHGKSNINQMLLGSVSENIIRHARRPVLVVRRPEE
ncbi:MAG: universal stress protein [Methanomicrobiales archaeon]